MAPKATIYKVEMQVNDMDRWYYATHALTLARERYLVDEALLVKLTGELGGQLIDPLKTTIVQNQRCMTTWVVRKNV